MVLWIISSRLLFVPMPHAYLTNKFQIENSWSSLPNIQWKKIPPSKILRPWILELEGIRKLILSLNKLVGDKDLKNMWALYIVGGMSLPPKILKSRLLRESWFIPAASHCILSLRHPQNPKIFLRSPGTMDWKFWRVHENEIFFKTPRLARTQIHKHITTYQHISTLDK